MCGGEGEGEGKGEGRNIFWGPAHVRRRLKTLRLTKPQTWQRDTPLPYNPGVTFTSLLFLLSRDSQNQTCYLFVIFGFVSVFIYGYVIYASTETLSFILFWVFETGSFYFWLFYVILFWDGLYYVVKAILKFCVDQVGLLSTEITLNLGKIFWEPGSVKLW